MLVGVSGFCLNYFPQSLKGCVIGHMSTNALMEIRFLKVASGFNFEIYNQTPLMFYIIKYKGEREREREKNHILQRKKKGIKEFQSKKLNYCQKRQSQIEIDFKKLWNKTCFTRLGMHKHIDLFALFHFYLFIFTSHNSQIARLHACLRHRVEKIKKMDCLQITPKMHNHPLPNHQHMAV